MLCTRTKTKNMSFCKGPPQDLCLTQPLQEPRDHSLSVGGASSPPPRTQVFAQGQEAQALLRSGDREGRAPCLKPLLLRCFQLQVISRPKQQVWGWHVLIPRDGVARPARWLGDGLSRGKSYQREIQDTRQSQLPQALPPRCSFHGTEPCLQGHRS